MSLVVLDASNNSLKDLPSELGNLTMLEKLNISGNTKLNRLPSSLCNARNLVVLSLDTNSFNYPPRDIIEAGVESVLTFLCSGKYKHLRSSLLLLNIRYKIRPKKYIFIANIMASLRLTIS